MDNLIEAIKQLKKEKNAIIAKAFIFAADEVFRYDSYRG